MGGIYNILVQLYKASFFICCTLITTVMFILYSISNSLKLRSVKQTSIYENSELKSTKI